MIIANDTINEPPQLEKLPESLKPLSQEIEFYFNQLPMWLEDGYEGKCALIHKNMVEIYDTYDKAIEGGLARHGKDVPFLAQMIDSQFCWQWNTPARHTFQYEAGSGPPPEDVRKIEAIRGIKIIAHLPRRVVVECPYVVLKNHVPTGWVLWKWRGEQ